MLKFYKKCIFLSLILIILIINLIFYSIIKNDTTEVRLVQINYVQINASDSMTEREDVAETKQPAARPLDGNQLREIIDFNNLKPIILNKHFLFGDAATSGLLPADTLVVLIQVHNRVDNLRVLISSLSDVRYIDRTLLIFSHDVYNETINRVIESINFASVVQIFYPYMLQLYENRFPGRSENDCPVRNASGGVMNCTNSEYPDRYGNYRDHKLVQIKHHWFWKISFVFDLLHFTKQVKELDVLLLEEDFYVFPDAVQVFRLLKEKVKNDTVEIISLSDTYIEHTRPDFQNHSNSYSVCKKHLCTSAMVFNRKFWNMLKANAEHFCGRDDYNWDWTLQYVATTHFNLPIKCVFTKAARVLHLGNCGSHHKYDECDAEEMSRRYRKMTSDNRKYLYPDNLTFSNELEIPHVYDIGNGGWADVRDHLLCKSFINKTFLRTLETVFKTKL